MKLPDPVFWRGRHVFLTGHTGFKGSWAVLLLRRLGARVTGFALPGPITRPDLFHTADINQLCEDHRGDLRDFSELRNCLGEARPDIVLHMAAQSIVRLSIKDPVDTIDINVLGVAKILEAVRQTPGVGVCAIVTSDKCYENRERIWAYREDEAMGGKDPYSASKGAAEIITAAFARSYFADGPTRVISLRSGNVIGGGDWAADRLIPDLIRAARDERPVDIRSPSAVRPWQHVLDALIGYLLAIEHAAKGPARAFDAWNFGPNPGEELTVRALVDVVQQHWQGVLEARFASEDHEAARREEAGLLRVDNTKAKAELGWRPGRSNAEAIAATVAWYGGVLGGQSARDVSERQLNELTSLST